MGILKCSVGLHYFNKHFCEGTFRTLDSDGWAAGLGCDMYVAAGLEAEQQESDQRTPFTNDTSSTEVPARPSEHRINLRRVSPGELRQKTSSRTQCITRQLLQILR